METASTVAEEASLRSNSTRLNFKRVAMKSLVSVFAKHDASTEVLQKFCDKKDFSERRDSIVGPV